MRLAHAGETLKRPDHDAPTRALSVRDAQRDTP
jgi:hypothetical protein